MCGIKTTNINVKLLIKVLYIDYPHLWNVRN